MGLGVKRAIVRSRHAARLLVRWIKLSRAQVFFANESRGIDMCDIVYINLDHRTDRKDHLESEFAALDVSNYQRLSAVKNDNGALGCAMSHVKALTQWKPEPSRLLMICEDDCHFLATRKHLDHLINRFFADSRLDVLCLAYNISNKLKIDRDFYITSDTQTTSCYIVKATVLDEMLGVARKSVDLLSSGTDVTVGSIDQVWKELQRERIFCVPTQRAAAQTESYSDIEKRLTNYGV